LDFISTQLSKLSIPIEDTPLRGLNIESASACSASRPMTRELAYELAERAAYRLRRINELRKELPEIPSKPKYTQ